jgi:ribosomal protein S18 acetylase RimI-like enzyme
MSTEGEPSASVQLRTAVAGDAAAIADCVAQAYGPWVSRIGRKPWPMLRDYAAVVRDELVTVAQIADRIVGVLVLSVTDEGLLVENVAAHPDWKGRGVGRILLRHAEREARRLACSCVYLYTNELMVENIALYARYGYVEYERRQEEGFRRVFMRKTLTSDA